MSIFNLKLKTKNGNDVKKKETFTVLFALNYKRGLKTTAEYTYRIMSSRGIIDTGKVMGLKDADKVKSREDLTLKVILNFCHLIGKMSQKYNIDPDFVLFMSPDFGGTNNAWKFLKDVFDTKTIHTSGWDEAQCHKLGINKIDLDYLKAFVAMNPDCHFMTIDPERNNGKYARSIHVCGELKQRFEGQPIQVLTDHTGSIKGDTNF